MNSEVAVSLAELESALTEFRPRLSGEPQTPLSAATQDSRRAAPGTLFIARTGERVSGLSYLPQATALGASAVLAEVPRPAGCALPWLQVTSLNVALALAADFIYRRPSSRLKLIGITGTNGKTTTAHLVDATLRALDLPVARLGTLGYKGAEAGDSTGLTTPEADAVSRYLSEAVSEGARYFVMEVSSHALAKERVAACDFAVAAFSNLTQDHLDYHGTLSAYAETKARLFDEGRFQHAVINVDDKFGAEIADRVNARGQRSVLRVSQRPDANSEVRLLSQSSGAHGTEMRVATPQGELAFQTQLVSAHNRDNWLLALGILHAAGVELKRFPEVAPAVTAAPGRLSRCDESIDDISVLVDYAHTPDALFRALTACRGFCKGKLLLVFGCGGDRDPDKRAKMGAVAAEYADYSIVTNDNPRSEEPARIADAITLGMSTTGAAFEVCLSRDMAIQRAVVRARSGDCVLIAGKGHEDYQIVGAQRLHFDDAEQARAALRLRRNSAAGGVPESN